MKNIIFTVNIGRYDITPSPSIVTAGWQYVAITDNPSLIGDGWDLVKVPLGDVQQSRSFKIDPWRLFNNFETLIYVDGNIQPNCDLDQFVKSYHKGGVTLRKHPRRSCVYDEAEAVIRLKKDEPARVNLQIEKYRREGYPRNNGLVSADIIIRSNTPEVQFLCKTWLTEVCLHSHRDQLSFNYSSWKSGVKYDTMPSEVLKTHFIKKPHFKSFGKT